MGWFWADNQRTSTIKDAPHPIPQPGATPPPACPMHDTLTKSTTPSPLQQRLSQTSQPTPPTDASSCPVNTPSQASQYPTPEKKSWSSSLNPLNFMPTFTNERPAESLQRISLPLEKETSTIPRGDSDQNWEYPSPQQMYNALLRKGHTDTPAEDVEAMVAVHNFLNEGAWEEIVTWETIFKNGIAQGWSKCRQGEEGISLQKARDDYQRALTQQRREQAGIKEDLTKPDPTQPRLLRFQGRPKEPTPKARMLGVLAYVFPASFGQEPPFDRHDWYVARPNADGSTKEVRYVIDYYGGGLQATGEPVFYLDIRPALDSPVQVMERVVRWSGDVWWRAKGGDIRAELARS